MTEDSSPGKLGSPLPAATAMWQQAAAGAAVSVQACRQGHCGAGFPPRICSAAAAAAATGPPAAAQFGVSMCPYHSTLSHPAGARHTQRPAAGRLCRPTAVSDVPTGRVEAKLDVAQQAIAWFACHIWCGTKGGADGGHQLGAAGPAGNVLGLRSAEESTGRKARECLRKFESSGR